MRGEAYYRLGDYQPAMVDLKLAHKHLLRKIEKGAPDSNGLFLKTNIMLSYSSLLKGNLADAEAFFLQAKEEKEEHPTLFNGEMKDLSIRLKEEHKLERERRTLLQRGAETAHILQRTTFKAEKRGKVAGTGGFE